MTTRMTLFTLGTSLAFGIGMHAQTAAPDRVERLASSYVDPAGGVDLDGAVARALGQEPALRAARSEIDAARGARLQAALGPNPTVSFSQQEQPSGSDSQTRVEVVWPLDLLRRTGRVNVADREVEASRLVAADRERLLAADVRLKYGEVAGEVRALGVLDDLVEVASRQQALVAARVAQGASPPIDRDMLRVDLQRLESERLRQAGSVERALMALKRLLGMSADAPLTIRDTLEPLVHREDAAPLAADAATAVNQRPDVEAAASQVRVAEAQIDQARRNGGVDASLFGSYMRMDSGFPQRAFDAAGTLMPIRGVFHYVAAGVSVNVPLRDRNQGEVAKAQASRAAASARLDAVRLTVQAEVAEARVRDEYARQAVAIYTSGTRDLAKHNLTVVEQTYELGRATVSDVLAERHRYLEVEQLYTDTLREAYEARQALRRALGDVR